VPQRLDHPPLCVQSAQVCRAVNEVQSEDGRRHGEKSHGSVS